MSAPLTRARLLHSRGATDAVIDLVRALPPARRAPFAGDPALAPLWTDERFANLFADGDVPCHPHLAVALTVPEQVRGLRLADRDRLPHEVTTLRRLEVLRLPGFRGPALPDWLADLPRLRSVEVRGGLRELPLGVLAMPSLRRFSWHSPDLPTRFRQDRVRQLLASFARNGTSPRQRQLHVRLLFGGRERVAREWSLRELLAALDADLEAVRLAASHAVELARPVRITPGDEISLVGELGFEPDVAAAALAALDVRVVDRPGAATRVAVVGGHAGAAATRLLDAGIAVTGPVAVTAALAGRPTLSPPDGSVSVADLLGSDAVDNVALALGLMPQTGVPPDLLRRVIRLGRGGPADVRAAANEVLALRVAAVGNPRLRYSRAAQRILSRFLDELHGPERPGERHRDYIAMSREPAGTSDAVALAAALGDPFVPPDGGAVQRRALSARIRDGVLDLRGIGLDEIPETVSEFDDVRHLLLSDNRIRTVPVHVGRMRGLRTLALDGNPLDDPPYVATLLSDLRELRLTVPSVEAATEVFDLVEHWPELHHLHLTGYLGYSLPDPAGRLDTLRTLCVVESRLTVVPQWMVRLPVLRRLNLRGTRIVDRALVNGDERLTVAC